MKKILCLFLTSILLLTLLVGCANNKLQDESQSGATTDEISEVNSSNPDTDMFTQRDFKTEYDESKAVTIQLNGTSATASSDSVKISGSTITITEEATYVVSGQLSDGMLIVNAPDTAKLQLVFNGVNITSETSAALYILEADKVFLTLADGTTNTLANGGSFTAIDNNNIDSALFSKQDLTLNGTGSLTVTSPAGHGVICKDDLVITGGYYEVNSAFHGLDANDSVRVTNATLSIDAGKDSIHCENNDDTSKGFVYILSGNIKAEAEGDGISAGAYMQIQDGTIDLLVGGGSENGTKEHSDSFGEFMGGDKPKEMPPKDTQITENEKDSTSMKGLKATSDLIISGGNFKINSADDALNSDTSLTIKGGTYTIASGDDAVHAEETLTIIAGEINISESYEGLEALHIDVQGGNIKLKARDDGLNGAGGTDQSGTAGGRDGMFGGEKPGGMRGHGGGMSANSNGSVKISGGTIYINSSGDGVDANGTLEISGGHTTVTGPTKGDTSILDYDKTAIITGGTFIGTGSTMMAQSFSDSNQGVIAINVGNQVAETQIELKESNSNTIVSHKPELDFAVVIISTEELVKGEKYSITVGDETGEIEAS